MDWKNDVNAMGYGGISIGDLNPRMSMIGGLIKNTTVTPYQMDEFLYSGFTFAFDDNAQYIHSDDDDEDLLLKMSV